MALQRILVPYVQDGGQAALDFAEVLAKPSKATLSLLHVVEPPGLLSAMVPGARREADSTSTAAASTKVLDELRKRLEGDGLVVETLTREGSIVQIILEEAVRGNFDLIVMGVHGRSVLGRLLYGTAAAAIMGGAPCPVAVVPRSHPRPARR